MHRITYFIPSGATASKAGIVLPRPCNIWQNAPLRIARSWEALYLATCCVCASLNDRPDRTDLYWFLVEWMEEFTYGRRIWAREITNHCALLQLTMDASIQLSTHHP
mmetsp:Transcript_27996/g.49675  ORF Transcript_27996/g.49675 Transcript_27996/m.49675 type:complete len:107 (+) Transcript_27996:842-1162(+)